MTDGYSAGFPLGHYPVRFHREAAPAWLAAIVTARGVVAPTLRQSKWCEIGCGQGGDTLIFAATNPDMQFWGIDVNPDHIAAAVQMAKAAGIDNAHFLCADIRDDAALSGLPERFDFIIQHGIYSWVSGDIRTALRNFTATRLSPQGVALIHYMSQPGAAVFMALQKMIASLGDAQRTVSQRIHTLRNMATAGAGFFALYPHASSILDRLATDDPALVAHEYLGVEPTAFAASEVIHDFADLGLSFVGSARPIENYDDVSLPGNVAQCVAAEHDPAVREMLRDIGRNQHLRYDIYQKSPHLLTPEQRWEVLQDQRYLASGALPASGPLVFQSAIGPVEGAREIFDPLFSCFKNGQVRFGDVALALHGQAGLAHQSIMMLMGAGMLHPMIANNDMVASDRLEMAMGLSGDNIMLRIEPRIGSAIQP